MKKVVGKVDDFVMDALFYFEPVQRFESLTGVICSVLGFQLLHEQGNFAVAEDEISVFAVILGNVSCSSLI